MLRCVCVGVYTNAYVRVCARAWVLAPSDEGRFLFTGVEYTLDLSRLRAVGEHNARNAAAAALVALGMRLARAHGPPRLALHTAASL